MSMREPNCSSCSDICLLTTRNHDLPVDNISPQNQTIGRESNNVNTIRGKCRTLIWKTYPESHCPGEDRTSNSIVWSARTNDHGAVYSWGSVTSVECSNRRVDVCTMNWMAWLESLELVKLTKGKVSECQYDPENM